MSVVSRLVRVFPLLTLALAVAAVAQELSAADRDAAFAAAGFARQGEQWRACDDPTPSYVPGAIETVRDLNGDGLPEVVITEGGSFCHGHAGTGFVLVSKQADGSWKRLYADSGMALFLETKGAGGWPDLQIGGPGFCFPVARWDGREYRVQRHEYEGKPCRDD